MHDRASGEDPPPDPVPPTGWRVFVGGRDSGIVERDKAEATLWWDAVALETGVVYQLVPL